MSHKLDIVARKIGNILCQRRSSFIGSHVAKAVSTLYYTMSNVNFDIRNNGERRVISLCQEFFDENCVFFDVGANYGHWTEQVLEFFPKSKCYLFEPFPDNNAFLEEKFHGDHRVQVNKFGLSNKHDKVALYTHSSAGGNTSAFRIEDVSNRKTKGKREVICEFWPGIDFVSLDSIQKIDFLKIDVEGMEFSVLKGFDSFIGSIRVIQFEYGVFNIVSKDLLFDITRFLNSKGFIVGQIYPQGVRFFEYHFQEEKFMGNNYIAVKPEDIEIMRALEGKFTNGPLKYEGGFQKPA